MAEVTRRPMEQRLQPLDALGGEDGLGPPVGPARLRVQGGEARGIEGMDGVAHGLLVAGECPRNVGHTFTAGAGEHDEAAPERDSVGRAQTGSDLGALLVAKRTDEDGTPHLLHLSYSLVISYDYPTALS